MSPTCAVMLSAVPKTALKIAWMAPFQARATTQAERGGHQGGDLGQDFRSKGHDLDQDAIVLRQAHKRAGFARGTGSVCSGSASPVPGAGHRPFRMRPGSPREIRWTNDGTSSPVGDDPWKAFASVTHDGTCFREGTC